MFLYPIVSTLPWYPTALEELKQIQHSTSSSNSSDNTSSRQQAGGRGGVGKAGNDAFTIPVLDIGCGLGQELRFLATDGINTTELYGMDTTSDLWDAGAELFRDRDRFGFLKCDVMDPDLGVKLGALATARQKALSSEVSSSRSARDDGYIKGSGNDNGSDSFGGSGNTDNEGINKETKPVTVKLLLTSLFFHLFDHPTQLAIASTLVHQLSAPGTRILGHQMGQIGGFAYKSVVREMEGRRPDQQHRQGQEGVGEGQGEEGTLEARTTHHYLHDEGTWRGMWDEVEMRTGTKWIVEGRVRELWEWGGEGAREDSTWVGPDAKAFEFCCLRVR